MAHRHAMPLPRDLVEEIAEIGIRRRLPAHTIATHEGDPGETFCVLLRGSARLSLDGEDGRSVDLGTLHPGDYFGEMMIDGGGRAATVLTLEPCEVIAISRRQFGELLASRPDFAKHVMLKLAARVRTLARLVKQLALMDVDGRVRALLLELAEQEGVDLVVRPAPSQQAIADRVGASRSMINRVMKRLGAEGFVRAAGDRLILRR
jgi:CRP/FNR family cyclic AMP-dependent transcriptional regulator